MGQISTVDKSFTAVDVNQALFPSSGHRIGWGYGDFSLRLFSSDEKVGVMIGKSRSSPHGTSTKISKNIGKC